MKMHMEEGLPDHAPSCEYPYRFRPLMCTTDRTFRRAVARGGIAAAAASVEVPGAARITSSTHSTPLLLMLLLLMFAEQPKEYQRE